MGKKNFFIGTAGYFYTSWIGSFYPTTLKRHKFLEYYSNFFNFVEINSSFYKLISKNSLYTYRKKPLYYVFKIYKEITHKKELDFNILSHHLILKEKLNDKLLGILVQFPPKFSPKEYNKEKILKINEFFQSNSIMPFFEVREKNWDNEKEFFKANKLNVVLPSFPKYKNWSKIYNIEKEFLYIRLHGNRKLYSSSYTKKELEDFINKGYLAKNIIISFNNTENAIKDAILTINILKNCNSTLFPKPQI